MAQVVEANESHTSVFNTKASFACVCGGVFLRILLLSTTASVSSPPPTAVCGSLQLTLLLLLLLRGKGCASDLGTDGKNDCCETGTTSPLPNCCIEASSSNCDTTASAPSPENKPLICMCPNSPPMLCAGSNVQHCMTMARKVQEKACNNTNMVPPSNGCTSL